MHGVTMSDGSDPFWAVVAVCAGVVVLSSAFVVLAIFVLGAWFWLRDRLGRGR